jgi:hypothetical protein
MALELIIAAKLQTAPATKKKVLAGILLLFRFCEDAESG